MNRYSQQSRQQYQGTNPITAGFMYGTTSKPRKTVDGFAHICADGHNHATEMEVKQCIEAHKVFVCSSNHMHTERCDAERCDQIKREEETFKDKELQRQHEREMMDRNIKLADNLRGIGWNFKTHGMPELPWKD